mmetsp:Transcript_35126/g.81391  ORF Transcript_35126/g.81391 Transcript_35126/m.81391 type:complete len:244 (-) Transcript_35126:729-1460(-)
MRLMRVLTRVSASAAAAELALDLSSSVTHVFLVLRGARVLARLPAAVRGLDPGRCVDWGHALRGRGERCADVGLSAVSHVVASHLDGVRSDLHDLLLLAAKEAKGVKSELKGGRAADKGRALRLQITHPLELDCDELLILAGRHVAHPTILRLGLDVTHVVEISLLFLLVHLDPIVEAYDHSVLLLADEDVLKATRIVLDNALVESEPKLVELLLECSLTGGGLALGNEPAVAIAHDRLVENC